MPGLSYPFHFQCVDCGEHLVVKRSDAQNLSDDPDSVDGLLLVLKERGWKRSSSGVSCPECAAAV